MTKVRFKCTKSTEGDWGQEEANSVYNPILLSFKINRDSMCFTEIQNQKPQSKMGNEEEIFSSSFPTLINDSVGRKRKKY